MNFNKVRGSFFSLGNGNSDSIISRSSKATCGAFEREIVVRNENVASVKTKLRAKGMMIVGTSESLGSTRKIWFVPRGAAML